MVRRLPTTCLTEALRLGMREQVHVRRVEPDEPGLAGVVLPLDEVARRRDEFVVARLHPLLVQRPGVLDLLLPGTAPARFVGPIVLVGRPRTNNAARAEGLPEIR